MVENKLKSGEEVVCDYIRRGTSWTPLKQLHFMDIIKDRELEAEGALTMTLNQIFEGDDFIDTVELMRQIYIPNYSVEETVVLVDACFWAEKNRKKFEDKNIQTRWNRLPDSVQMNFQTVSFPILCTDPSKHINIQKIPVGFEAESEAWENDIRSCTLNLHDRIRIYDVYTYGKKINPNTYSTSRSLNLIKDFYWSGGVYKRYEAIDTLTWTMLKQYRLHLLKRRRLLINLGVDKMFK